MGTLCCVTLLSFLMPIGDKLPPGALARFGEYRFRTGSSNDVLALSPNGKWIAVACPFDNIAILDAETGRRIQLLKPKVSQSTEEHRFATITWSHGSTTLAGLDCQQKRVCVWDVPSGRYLQTFVHKGFPEQIYRCDLVVTADRVVVRCENCPWVGKLTDGEFQPIEGEQPGTSYHYFDISPDEKYLAVVSHTYEMNAQGKDRRRDEVRVYELANGTVRKTLKTGKETSAAIFAGSSNRILADHNYDHSGSWLYDLDSGMLLQKSERDEKLPHVYRENHACVWTDNRMRRIERSYDGGKTRQRFRASGIPGFASVAFLKDGTLRFVRNNGSNLEVWDWANQPNAKPVPRHNPNDPDLQNTLLLAAFCNDGKGLRTLHQTGVPIVDATEIVHLREFDLATQVCTRLVTSDFRTREPVDLERGSDCRIDCSNADLSLLVLRTWRRNALGTRTWKTVEGQLDFIIPSGSEFFTLTDSGKQLLRFIQHQQSLTVHDLEADTERRFLLVDGSTGYTDTPVLVKAKGELALVVRLDGPCRAILANWKKCTQLDRFQVSLKKLKSIDLTPNGNFAIVASPVGFHLHHTRLHVLLARHEPDDVRIATGPVLAPDGNSFAVALHRNGSSDASVEIWDLFGTGPRASFNGHIGSVKRLGFSPEGTKLVSVGDDSTAIVWD
jgi:WD40 repeat protein